jgi:hypothetical protein
MTGRCGEQETDETRNSLCFRIFEYIFVNQSACLCVCECVCACVSVCVPLWGLIRNHAVNFCFFDR